MDSLANCVLQQQRIMSIRVSIVEDDRLVRESLAILINGTDDLRCAGAYATAEEALANVAGDRPNVVMMDINLPGMSGMDCARKIKQMLPEAQILMLSMFEDDEKVFHSLMAGASGYLAKHTPPADILKAIIDIHRGASPMSPKVSRTVVRHFHRLQAAHPEGESLSKREREVLELLSKGYRYKEIAGALSIGFETVRSHIKHIYEKLGVGSRTEAVVKHLGA